MITRETVICAGDFKVRFTVYDDIEWIVSISNDKLEVGASSDYCYSNWNKGLAEAIDNIAPMLSGEDVGKLLYELGANDFVDMGFKKYLKNYYSPCLACPHRDECECSPATCCE